MGKHQINLEEEDENGNLVSIEMIESNYLDPSLEVKGRQKAADGGANRMWLLKVTDGVNVFELMETKRFN